MKMKPQKNKRQHKPSKDPKGFFSLERRARLKTGKQHDDK